MIRTTIFGCKNNVEVCGIRKKYVKNWFTIHTACIILMRIACIYFKQSEIRVELDRILVIPVLMAECIYWLTY